MTTLAPALPVRTLVSSAEHPTLRRFTAEEYHHLVGWDCPDGEPRTELIDGLIYAMAPFSPPHIAVVNRLNEALMRVAAGDARVSVQNTLRLDDGTEPEPDLVLLRLETPEDRVPEAADALLVVEVSVTTEAFDRGVKLARYAAAGIPEAWIVIPDRRTVEAFTAPGPGGYAQARLVGVGETLDVLGRPLDADGLFPPPRPA